jgi:D-lyxose ketol-isomerase
MARVCLEGSRGRRRAAGRLTSGSGGRATAGGDGATAFVLKPGESITLKSLLFHEFWPEPGTGTSLCWEVISVNEDDTDNVSLETMGGSRILKRTCLRLPGIAQH